MSQIWFKYTHVFQLSRCSISNAEQLTQALQVHQFKSCTPHMPSSMGWYSPFDDPDAALVHSAQGCLLFALQLEDKILPTTVIRDEVNERIKQIQATEQRNVHGKEKARLRDEVTVSLLPKAFSKRQLIHAYLDPVAKLLVVNTESASKLTLFQKLFHQSIPEMKLLGLPLRTLNLLMTEWLMHPELLAEHLEFADACVLENPEKEQNRVRCQRQMLLSEGIMTFLKNGFKVNQMRLQWREQLEFTLRADGGIAQMKFLDIIQSMREDIEVETAAEQLDADFFIMTQTFREFFQEFLPLICQADRLSELTENREQTDLTVEADAERLVESF